MMNSHPANNDYLVSIFETLYSNRNKWTVMNAFKLFSDSCEVKMPIKEIRPNCMQHFENHLYN